MKKTTISAAASVALSMSLFVVPAFSDDLVESSFDMSYGTSGVVRISDPASTRLTALTALSNGEIFISGSSMSYLCGSNLYSPIAAILDNQGNLKPSFANGGLYAPRTLTQCESQWPDWAFQNSDGKIWMERGDDNQVIAFQMDPNSNNVSEFALASLTNVANLDYSMKAITATDGKFYVVGKTYTSSPRGFIARFMSDGSLDSNFNSAGISGFGQAGVMLLPFGFEPSDVKLLSDNGALVSGQYRSGGTQDGVVLRVSATGTYVNSFGVNGVATFPGVDWLSSIFVKSDESAIYAISNYVWILKIDLATGAISNSYGVNGATNAIAGTNLWSATTDPIGNIYVLAYSNDGRRYLIKIKNDGYIDESFNSSGYFFFPTSFAQEGYWKMDYGSDGYLYLGATKDYGFGSTREDILVSRISAKLDSTSLQSPPSALNVGSTWTPGSVRSAGIDRSITTSTHQICTFQNGILTAITPGTCRFTITDGGNSYWKQSVSNYEVTIPVPPLPVAEDRIPDSGTSNNASAGGPASSQVVQLKQQQSIGLVLPATAKSGKSFDIPLTTNAGSALTITASKFCKITKESKSVTKLKAYNKKIRAKERYVVTLANGKQKTKTRTVTKEVVRYKKVKEREQTGWNLELLKQGKSCDVTFAAKESDGFNALNQSRSIEIK